MPARGPLAFHTTLAPRRLRCPPRTSRWLQCQPKLRMGRWPTTTLKRAVLVASSSSSLLSCASPVWNPRLPAQANAHAQSELESEKGTRLVRASRLPKERLGVRHKGWQRGACGAEGHHQVQTGPADFAGRPLHLKVSAGKKGPVWRQVPASQAIAHNCTPCHCTLLHAT